MLSVPLVLMLHQLNLQWPLLEQDQFIIQKACSENSPGLAKRIPSICKIRLSNKSNTTCPP